MSQKTPRLALLLCDTPIPAVLQSSGDYHEIFKTLFRSALPSELADFAIDAYDVRNKMEYPGDSQLDDYDGVVITGSAASAYEDVLWISNLVKWVANISTAKPKLKIIGICFGHQIIARALGADCVPNGGKWEVGVTEVGLTDLGRRIFGADVLNIQQMHRDHVPTIPLSCHLLGSTPVSMNQGFVRFSPPTGDISAEKALPPIQIFTLQGHPEFTASIVKELVDLRSANGIIDTNTAENARVRANWRNDGVDVAGKAIWQVIRA